MVAVYLPLTKLPPTAGSVTSVKAPPLRLGEEISSTPPSKVLSRLKVIEETQRNLVFL
jgi:hypothetical protein